MKKVALLLVLVLSVIPIVYLLSIYNSLPEQVPTHFGIDGRPDDYSNKATLFVILIFLTILSIGVYCLLINVHKIDPKRSAQLSIDAMQKIAVGVVVLMSAVSILIIHSAQQTETHFERILLPLLGLFFAYLGNFMHSVKPNYFVGIRTPWALEDEETWRRTHRLAGKLWFAGGLLIAIAGVIFNLKIALIFLFSITAIITLIPAVFSYYYYKRHHINT